MQCCLHCTVFHFAVLFGVVYCGAVLGWVCWVGLGWAGLVCAVQGLEAVLCVGLSYAVLLCEKSFCAVLHCVTLCYTVLDHAVLYRCMLLSHTRVKLWQCFGFC